MKQGGGMRVAHLYHIFEIYKNIFSLGGGR